MTQIKIEFENISIDAVLNDSETANKIKKILPISNSVNTWGDEIYFSIGVNDVENDSKEVVELGDLGYWPPGNAFCLFFGLTPASEGDKIMPASPVNVIGKILGDLEILKSIKSGDKVSINLV
ncbi:MAG: cyclophilin-like fold protein [Chloroflexota bacterium]|nr:cyclophilin-like fold protein [Chloroflexota bacterium]